ncbi:MAG: VWA domain-containing protein [Nitrososphaerota archaeon]
MREGLKDGNFILMKFLMKKDPKTLAEILQEPKIFKEMLKSTENTKMKLSAAMFLFGAQKYLTPEQKRVAKATLVKILMQLASKLSARGIRATKRCHAAFRIGLDEMEIEETLENMLGKKCVDYEDIIMVDREPKQRGVVLMLDISNSMQREKIVLATLAIGVLAYRLREDYFSIITFSHEVNVLKPIDMKISIAELLDKMLEIIPQGATNIGKALEEGLKQLSIRAVHEKFGIIVTDGWVTLGRDPSEVAKSYPRLHVLQVPIEIGGGDDRMCAILAQKGRGKHIKIKNFEEIPTAILEILK